MSSRRDRAAAIVTWSYAAGFGLPAPLVAAYLLRTGRLPRFLNLFEMYGGPWSSTLDRQTFAAVLMAFSGLSAITAWSGWRVWRGRRDGAVLDLALIPIEAIFWVGFALPIPWALALARIALLARDRKDR